MNRLIHSLTALALIMSAGCTILAIEEEPSSTLPMSWSLDLKAPASPANDQWWEAFGSSELNGLIDLAQVANRNLENVRQSLQLARIQWHTNQVPWAPDIGSGASAGRSGVLGVHEQNLSYGSSLNLSYTPDIWGAQRAVERGSKALWRAAYYDVNATALALRLAVVSQYFQLLNTREQIALATLNRRTAHRVLTLIRSRYRAGAIAELDLHQQQTLVAGMEVAMSQLRQQSQQITTTLAALLDLAPQELVIQAQDLSNIQLTEVSSGLPSDLLLRRPDLRSAEARLISAGANIDVARAAMFPTLSLSANAGVTSAHLLQLMHADPSWAAGLAISLPLWDQGRRVDQQRTALINRKMAINTYRTAVLTAFGEVENAMHASANLQEQQPWQDVQLHAARAALQMAESRYRVGAVDLQSLLTAQTAFYSAQQAASSLRYQRLQAACNLAVALGGTTMSRVASQ